MFKSLLFVGLSLIIFSCNESKSSAVDNTLKAETDSNSINSDMELSAIAPANHQGVEINVDNRKLIWTADLQFKVKNVDKSTKKISKLSEVHGASISDMELTSLPYRVENEIVIRVENKKFHKLVEALKGESIYMDIANINSNDVTEEFVDLESRLNTKREVRDRYIAILRTRTGTIEDVLNAEEKIRAITEEIEAKEGRIRYLQNQVNYSTISMMIYHEVDGKTPPPEVEVTYGDQMGESFNSGWSEVKSLLLGLVSIWPMLLLLISLGVWKRKWIKEIISSMRKKVN